MSAAPDRSRPRISVIIPTYSRPLPLGRCVMSLASQQYPKESFEVVVVDDGGDPPAAASLAGQTPGDLQLQLVRQPNQGAGVARTTGIARARGNILAFLDDDCSVPPDYLAAIDRVFQAHPDTQVVLVGLENPEPDNLYGRAWKFALDQTLEVCLRPSPDGRRTSGLLAGVMVGRREIFTSVGFDPVLNRGREDTDLLYQLQSRHVAVYYEPKIRVLHHHRQTLRSYLASFFAYGRGEFHLRRKWGGRPSPSRPVSLTSWRALRALLGTDGLRRGAAIYGVLWLKRHAFLCGISYEAAVCKSSPPGPPRWTTLGRALVSGYTGLALRACHRVFAPLRRRS